MNRKTGSSRLDPEAESGVASSRTRAIPSAWTDVQISRDPSTLVQVTARDSRGRKQYLYHSDLHAALVEFKGERLLAFVQALPQLRECVEGDLGLAGLPKKKVAAALVRLLEIALVGVGMEEQVLPDVQGEHVDNDHLVDVQGRQRARVVKRWQDLPRQVPFHYLDDAGHRRTLVAADVEEYVREAAGVRFSTKEFRTWAGFAFMTRGTAETEALLSTREMNHEVLRAAEPVARRLGTISLRREDAAVPAALLEAHVRGSLARTRRGKSGPADAMKPSLSFADRRAPAQPEDAAKADGR